MAYLLFEDGTSFVGGELLGEAHGECMVMSGNQYHQDVLCNPALFKKIVLFTFPHIGICGAFDKGQPAMAAGLICRSISNDASSPNSDLPFSEYIDQIRMGGMADADPREIALYIQKTGPQKVAISESLDRCAHILRFPPEPERPFDQESTLEQINHIALIDMGMTNKDKDYLLSKADMDVYNPDAPIEDLEDYSAYVIYGGCEDYVGMAENTVAMLMSTKKPMLGLSLGHMLMAKAMGWQLEKDRAFFGYSQPSKMIDSDRVLYSHRLDWYTPTAASSGIGSGTGKAIYRDADERGGICGIQYYDNCYSLAFEPDGYKEVNDFFKFVRGLV